MGMPLKVTRIGERAPLVVMDESATASVPLETLRSAIGMISEETAPNTYLEHLIDVAEGRVEVELNRAIREQTRRWYCTNDAPEYAFILPEPARAIAIRILNEDGTEELVDSSVFSLRGFYVNIRSGKQWPTPQHTYWALDIAAGFTDVPADVQQRVIEHAKHLYSADTYPKPPMPWRSRWRYPRPLARSWGGWIY